MKRYTFNDLENCLPIYTDIVKYGMGSRLLDLGWECLDILECFEEYEKCKDILPYLETIPKTTSRFGSVENKEKNGNA